MSAKSLVLGGGVAGFAAGVSGLPVYDESPDGQDFAYCVPVGEAVRRYRRALRSSWARTDKAVRRTYQFCSLGIVPMTAPSRLALEYFRRHTGVLGRALNAQGPLNALSIEAPGMSFVMLDPAHFMSELSNLCNVKRGRQVSKISTSRRILSFFGHELVEFDQLVSTIPLDQMLALTGRKLVTPTAASMQILNLGLKLTDGLPVASNIHQLLFDRTDPRTMLDAVDIYSHVDYEAFTPTFDKAPRIALAAKHILGPNEVELTPEGFKARVIADLEKLGFRGHVEAAEYHFHDHGLTPSVANDEVVEAIYELEKIGIIQVGSVAQARPLRLDRDLLDGFAAGIALA